MTAKTVLCAVLVACAEIWGQTAPPTPTLNECAQPSSAQGGDDALSTTVENPCDWRKEMWEHTVTLCTGVTLRAYALEKPRMMKAYVARINLTTPGIGFTATERDRDWGRPMTDYTNETWIINTKRETTEDFMSRRRREGMNVEIAVNTSGWRPWGGRAACGSTYAALYRWELADGVEISHGKKPGNGTYFIVRKNGRAEIRSRIRPAMTNDMVFALYGNRHLLRNGAPTRDVDPSKFREVHPRTAFGLTADRNTLVMLAVDGRQPGYSEGATRADLVDILLREGCTDAVNMDGGGSTSLVVFDRDKGRPLMLNRHAKGYVRKTALNLGVTFGKVEPVAPCAKDAVMLSFSLPEHGENRERKEGQK